MGSLAMAERDPLNEPAFTSVGDTRTINDGVVTALAQDERGLIWIGTTVGLVRHDGYQLRRVTVGGKPATRRQLAPHQLLACGRLAPVLCARFGGARWRAVGGAGWRRPRAARYATPGLDPFCP
jgi:hypothetical protein